MLKFLCIVALLVCLTAALPAPAEEAKEVVAAPLKADEALEGSESGYYGGWGRPSYGGWGGSYYGGNGWNRGWGGGYGSGWGGRSYGGWGGYGGGYGGYGGWGGYRSNYGYPRYNSGWW